jgi:hypothetical protein
MPALCRLSILIAISRFSHAASGHHPPGSAVCQAPGRTGSASSAPVPGQAAASRPTSLDNMRLLHILSTVTF